MPTLLIAVGHSRFESFHLSPQRFLNFVETPDLLDINTKIFKMIYN